MTEPVPVRVNGVDFYVEVAEVGEDGVGTISLTDASSFEGVTATIEAVAGELGKIWQRVRPAEATVEFGLKLTGKSGKLTGLLVEGGGEAALTVTLKWGGLDQAVAPTDSTS